MRKRPPLGGRFRFWRALQAPSMPLDLSTAAAEGPVSTLMKALAASACLAPALRPTA